MRNNRLFIFSFLLLHKLLFSQAAITSVTSPNNDDIYGNGDIVYIAVNFLEKVYVTGTPILILETGSSNAGVNYSYGSGTKTLFFEYTVEEVHQSNDLEVFSFAPIMPGSDVSIKISSGSVIIKAIANVDMTIWKGSRILSLKKNKIRSTRPGIIVIKRALK